MKNIKAVIFDLDGVLVEMPDAHYIALNKALSYFGTTISREDHLKNFNGLPTKIKLQKLSEKKLIPKRMCGFINELKQVFTFELIPIYCTKDNSTIKLLSYLKHNNIKLGCFSNSIRKTLLKMLESAGIKKYFEVILSNEDVDNPKPDPEGYLKAMKMLGVTKNETVIVEDSPLGILSAKKASPHKVVQVSNTKDVNINLFYGKF